MERRQTTIWYRAFLLLSLTSFFSRTHADVTHDQHPDSRKGGFLVGVFRNGPRRLSALSRLCPSRMTFVHCENSPENQLCAPELIRQKCFEKHIRGFISNNSKRHTSEAEIRGTDVRPSRERSRRSWRLCPASLDTMVCFEHYMALWISLVSSSEGKRTFGPGKRAVTSTPGDVNKERPAPQPSHACADRGNRLGCLRSQLRKLLGFLTREGHSKRSMTAVCRDQDPMACFDHYLTQLARFQTSKQGAKSFVGKRVAGHVNLIELSGS